MAGIEHSEPSVRDTMFLFRKPRCPIDDDTRLFVDDRMQWLVSQFGRGVLQRTIVVVPTTDFFPDRYEPTEPCLYALFDRICGYMNVDRSLVTVRFYNHNSSVTDFSAGLKDYQTSAVGRYDESNGTINVWVNINSLDNPPAVVATMAHELGQVQLIGIDRKKRLLFPGHGLLR